MIGFVIGWVCCIVMVALYQHINKEYQELLEELSPSKILQLRGTEFQKSFWEGYNDALNNLNYERGFREGMDLVKNYLNGLGIPFKFTGVIAYHGFLVVSTIVSQKPQDFVVTVDKKVINSFGDIVYKGV